jgi:hypothetical protein
MVYEPHELAELIPPGHRAEAARKLELDPAWLSGVLNLKPHRANPTLEKLRLLTAYVRQKQAEQGDD